MSRSPKRGRRSHLIDQDMGVIVGEQLGAGGNQGADRDLVAHRATGDKKPRLVTKHRCHSLFELSDRWIFAIDVVTHFGIGHGFAHGC